MTPESKQRLVGIVVLLAFIALLIPFLFTSGIRKKQPVVDEIPINAEKRQLIDQQIQNINPHTEVNTTKTTPPITSVPSSLLPAAPPATQPQEPLTSSNPLPPENELINQSTQPIVTPPNSANVATGVAPAEEVTSASAESNDSVAVTDEVPKLIKATLQNNGAKKSIVTKKAKTTKITKGKNIKVGSKEFWTVQVGSFSNRARAQKLVAQLQAQGFRVYTQNIITTKATLTRVLIGREASKAQAEKIAKKLEATMKMQGHLVRVKK